MKTNFYFINTESLNSKFSNDTLFVSGHAIDQMIERKGIYTQERLTRILKDSIEFDPNIHYNLEVFAQTVSHPGQRIFFNEDEGVMFAVKYGAQFNNEALQTTMALCENEATYAAKGNGKYIKTVFNNYYRKEVDAYMFKHKRMSFKSYALINNIPNPFYA